MKRVSVVICFDTDARDEDIDRITRDMLAQVETLEDECGAEVAWADILSKSVEDIKE